MTYSPCASGCQATCANLTATEECQQLPCREMCVCPDGLLIDDDKCISEAECGCEYNGGYYSVSNHHHLILASDVIKHKLGAYVQM